MRIEQRFLLRLSCLKRFEQEITEETELACFDSLRRYLSFLLFNFVAFETTVTEGMVRYSSESNSSTNSAKRDKAVSTGSGFSKSTPASRRRSSGYLLQPP